MSRSSQADKPTPTLQPATPAGMASAAAIQTHTSPTCAPGSLCAGSVPTCLTTRVLMLVAWVSVWLAADQASKIHAMRHWKATSADPVRYLDGIFQIQYAENPGAFLSLFGGLDPAVRFWVLTVMNGVLLATVAGILLLRKITDLWSWTALVLILAGGIGNLIDRIRFDNHVIDFLVLTTGPWNVPFFGEIRTGIFNVADIAISAGFIMFLPGLFFAPANSTTTPESAPSTKA